ncbi:MAG: hypothetical protein ACTSQJ_04020 [Promethearchaeota archaeon]
MVKKQKINTKELRIYLKIAFVRKINQIVLGTTLCLFIILVIITAVSFSTLIFWPDILLSIWFWIFLGLLFAYSFTDDPINRIKPGISIFGNIFFGGIIFFMAIFYYVNFSNVLPIAYLISVILFIALCIGGTLMIGTNIYVLFFRHRSKKRSSEIFNIYQSGKMKKILFYCIICSGLSFGFLATPGIIKIPITIEPKDYQAEFAFWGGYGAIDNSTGELLNKYKITLIFCCYPDLNDEDGKNDFINTITEYNNSYPNLSIFISVSGYPGAFVWDGNLENVIDNAKKIISIKQDYNLTIIKGLAFDIEGPYVQLIKNIDASPNRIRHDESLELWYDFFDWMDDNAPELELNAINYVESAIDLFDNDYDLHYIRRYSFLDLDTDAFNEYAPMSYRGWYMGKKPYGDSMENPVVRYLDGGHYWVYTQLKLLAKALDKKFGNHNKMGVYLGITNCTCYSRDSPQYQINEPAGYGFDNLVRDALIAKHFGIKRITIFLLNTVVENGYSMGGVFDSYGEDFLDKFNESVNGKKAPDFFQIWYKPRFNYVLTFGHMDYFIYDMYGNLNSIIWILYISLIFIINCIIANYGWKKIKISVLKKEIRDQ